MRERNTHRFGGVRVRVLLFQLVSEVIVESIRESVCCLRTPLLFRVGRRFLFVSHCYRLNPPWARGPHTLRPSNLNGPLIIIYIISIILFIFLLVKTNFNKFYNNNNNTSLILN